MPVYPLSGGVLPPQERLFIQIAGIVYLMKGFFLKVDFINPLFLTSITEEK